jgi:hypothetical protein
MQHFLKPAAGTARTKVFPAQFLNQLLVSVNDANAAFDASF